MAVFKTKEKYGFAIPQWLYHYNILQCSLDVSKRHGKKYREYYHHYNINIDNKLSTYDFSVVGNLQTLDNKVRKMDILTFQKYVMEVGALKYYDTPHFLDGTMRYGISRAFLQLRRRLPKKSRKRDRLLDIPYIPRGPWEYIPDQHPMDFTSRAYLRLDKSMTRPMHFLDHIKLMISSMNRHSDMILLGKTYMKSVTYDRRCKNKS